MDAKLEEVWDEVFGSAGEGKPAPVGAKPPQKVSYTHDGVIDQIIAAPHMSQGQLAAMFGYTQAWLSTVMGSDAFKARLAQRRGEIIDPTLGMTVKERFTALTERSLEVLQEKLSAPSANIPDQLALRAAELGAKALGVGQPTLVVPLAPAGHLENLAQRLVSLQAQVQATGPGGVSPALETTFIEVIEG